MQEAFWASIDNAPGDQYVGTFEVDWGRRPRGQGKRAGGMVMGAMSDGPTGKKVYHRLLAKAPLSKKEAGEAALMETVQQVMIARALAAGHKPDVAFLVAYTVGSGAISRDEAYELISKLDKRF